MSRRVLLLRHGRTAWNAERRFQGQADPPLDEVGRMQALEVAALITAMRPAIIVTSDLQRAAQTAARVAELSGATVTVDERLRERSLGHWEGLTRDDVEQRYPDEFADWLAGRDISRRGGESRNQVAVRARAAFEAIPDVDVAVVVTHSATAMALCADVLGLAQDIHILSPLANCHWSELRHEADDVSGLPWRLRSHNVGAPGAVIPFPVHPELAAVDDAPDAEA